MVTINQGLAGVLLALGDRCCQSTQFRMLGKSCGRSYYTSRVLVCILAFS